MYMHADSHKAQLLSVMFSKLSFDDYVEPSFQIMSKIK